MKDLLDPIPVPFPEAEIEELDEGVDPAQLPDPPPTPGLPSNPRPNFLLRLAKGHPDALTYTTNEMK